MTKTNENSPSLPERSLEVAEKALAYLDSCMGEASVKDLVSIFQVTTRYYKEASLLERETSSEDKSQEEKNIDSYSSELEKMISKLVDETHH